MDTTHDKALERKVLSLLSEGRIMSVATIRPDGWPQVTTVGYVNAGLDLFFAVAATSQKFRNIQAEPRISIAVAFAPDGRRQGRGLSMAAHACQIVEADEIERINDILAKRYFGRAVFAPRGPSAVVLKATPIVISLTDDSDGIAEPQTFHVPGSERPSPPVTPISAGGGI